MGFPLSLSTNSSCPSLLTVANLSWSNVIPKAYSYSWSSSYRMCIYFNSTCKLSITFKRTLLPKLSPYSFVSSLLRHLLMTSYLNSTICAFLLSTSLLSKIFQSFYGWPDRTAETPSTNTSVLLENRLDQGIFIRIFLTKLNFSLKGRDRRLNMSALNLTFSILTYPFHRLSFRLLASNPSI